MLNALHSGTLVLWLLCTLLARGRLVEQTLFGSHGCSVQTAANQVIDKVAAAGQPGLQLSALGRPPPLPAAVPTRAAGALLRTPGYLVLLLY